MAYSYNPKIISALEKIRLVPVIVIESAEKAVPLAKALCEGGIPIAEITFRTEAAAEAMARIAEEVPEVLLGAGSVHDAKTAESAVKSGAKFIVTAGFNEAVVDWCMSNQVDVFPGCVTPSDLERLLLKGLNIAKFFPAGCYGGTDTLKSLAGPYGNIRFIPTGGIDKNNVMSYLNLKNVLAVGGSWLTAQKLIDDGNFKEITELAREAKGIIG